MSGGTKGYPYSVARTTGSVSAPLLAAILATTKLDEISDIEDFTGVERYIRHQGHVDAAGETTTGVMFWLYPTGLHGPYHTVDSDEAAPGDGGGRVELHGTLITIESGVLLREAMERARGALRRDEIGHLHITAE